MKPFKPQNKQPVAWEKFLLASLFITILGICETGCSVHMWREGWAIHSTTLDARKMAGYRRPDAAKTKNGDLVFKYDVRLGQYGVTGMLNDNEKILGLKRITNSFPPTALKPITNIWPLIDPDGFFSKERIYPRAVSTNAFVQTGQNLQILKVRIESDGGMRFPASECVVWIKEFIWYVPPLHTNDVPMAAVLSKETIHTPAYL